MFFCNHGKHPRQLKGIVDSLPPYYSLNLRSSVAIILNANAQNRPSALEIFEEAFKFLILPSSSSHLGLGNSNEIHTILKFLYLLYIPT